MSIELLQSELKRLEADGNTVVSIKALLTYIKGLSADNKKHHDLLMAKFSAANQSSLEKYKENRAEWRELFKAVISNGQAAIKLFATVNGGAALALLAFIGKVWVPQFPESVLGYNITLALLYFCIGLGIAAVTQGFSYLGQHCFTYDFDKIGRFIQIVTVFFGLFSMVLFFCGVLSACKGFGLTL